jgi:hypothetical protein
VLDRRLERNESVSSPSLRQLRVDREPPSSSASLVMALLSPLQFGQMLGFHQDGSPVTVLDSDIKALGIKMGSELQVSLSKLVSLFSEVGPPHDDLSFCIRGWASL